VTTAPAEPWALLRHVQDATRGQCGGLSCESQFPWCVGAWVERVPREYFTIRPAWPPAAWPPAAYTLPSTAEAIEAGRPAKQRQLLPTTIPRGEIAADTRQRAGCGDGSHPPHPPCKGTSPPLNLPTSQGEPCQNKLSLFMTPRLTDKAKRGRVPWQRCPAVRRGAETMTATANRREQCPSTSHRCNAWRARRPGDGGGRRGRLPWEWTMGLDQGGRNDDNDGVESRNVKQRFSPMLFLTSIP